MTTTSRCRLLSLLAACILSGGNPVGCSKESKPEAAATGASSSATPQPSAKAAGPLKVAFAYVGPVGDAGWTFAHDRGRKEVQAEFGDKVVTSFVENVPEA